MARLPIPGSDNGRWGDILNTFLTVEHHADGSLKRAATIENAQPMSAKGQVNGYVGLDSSAKIPSANLPDAASAQKGAIQLAGDLGGSAANPTIKNMARVYNIKDYGATGDGAADDTSAFAAAISAAANGGTVFVPPGTYIVDPSTSINITSNITLQGAGNGSVIKVKDNSDVLNNLIKVESQNNVTIRDLQVDGNRANQDLSDAVAVHYGIYIAASAHCRVENLWVHDTTGVGVHVYDCEGVIVTRCTSWGNRYHGFECEQARNCTFSNNYGYQNDRHGIFVSPGEVDGSGAIGNIIIANAFDGNSQYGIALGIAANEDGSVGLTRDNVVIGNSVRNNAHYGINLYQVDDCTVADNIVSENGFFGIYLYKAQRNQITGNRLHNNSANANGAYDEIMLEGANDGTASSNNLVANNTVVIDGDVKARYAVQEGSASDGPNTIAYNNAPYTGVAGTYNVQNTASVLTSPAGVAQVRGGQAIDGVNAGIDNAFNILRLYSNLANAEVQIVSTTAGIKFWSNGTERLLINADGSVAANTDTFRVTTAKTPASATAAGTAGDIAWDNDYVYVCVAANTWKRSVLSSW
jgi:parallel beta-helix repeat protein